MRTFPGRLAVVALAAILGPACAAAPASSDAKPSRSYIYTWAGDDDRRAGDSDFLVHVAVASPERLRDLILEHITTHPAVTKTETQLVFEVREGRGVLGPL